MKTRREPGPLKRLRLGTVRTLHWFGVMELRPTTGWDDGGPTPTPIRRRPGWWDRWGLWIVLVVAGVSIGTWNLLQKPYDVHDLARECAAETQLITITVRPPSPVTGSGGPNEDSWFTPDNRFKEGYLEQQVAASFAEAATCGHHVRLLIRDPVTAEEVEVLKASFRIDRSDTENLEEAVDNVVARAIAKAETRWYALQHPPDLPVV